MKNVPVVYWIIAIVALIWNLMGVGACVSQLTISPEEIAAMSEAEQEMYDRFPLWTKIAFVVAVFGGLIGSIGLLMRKKWSKTIFKISLVGILAQVSHSIFIAKAHELYGTSTLYMQIMIVVIGIFLVWYSVKADKDGYLN